MTRRLYYLYVFVCLLAATFAHAEPSQEKIRKAFDLLHPNLVRTQLVRQAYFPENEFETTERSEPTLLQKLRLGFDVSSISLSGLGAWTGFVMLFPATSTTLAGILAGDFQYALRYGLRPFAIAGTIMMISTASYRSVEDKYRPENRNSHFLLPFFETVPSRPVFLSSMTDFYLQTFDLKGAQYARGKEVIEELFQRNGELYPLQVVAALGDTENTAGEPLISDRFLKAAEEITDVDQKTREKIEESLQKLPDAKFLAMEILKLENENRKLRSALAGFKKGSGEFKEVESTIRKSDLTLKQIELLLI